MSVEEDLYDGLFDLEEVDSAVVKNLKDEIDKLQNDKLLLQKKIESISSTNLEIQKENRTLKNNISSLFKTAQTEIERKNRTIEQLRADSLKFVQNSNNHFVNQKQASLSERNSSSISERSNQARHDQCSRYNSKYSKDQSNLRHSRQEGDNEHLMDRSNGRNNSSRRSEHRNLGDGRQQGSVNRSIQRDNYDRQSNSGHRRAHENSSEQSDHRFSDSHSRKSDNSTYSHRSDGKISYDNLKHTCKTNKNDNLRHTKGHSNIDIRKTDQQNDILKYFKVQNNKVGIDKNDDKEVVVRNSKDLAEDKNTKLMHPNQVNNTPKINDTSTSSVESKPFYNVKSSRPISFKLKPPTVQEKVIVQGPRTLYNERLEKKFNSDAKKAFEEAKKRFSQDKLKSESNKLDNSHNSPFLTSDKIIQKSKTTLLKATSPFEANASSSSDSNKKDQFCTIVSNKAPYKSLVDKIKEIETKNLDKGLNKVQTINKDPMNNDVNTLEHSSVLLKDNKGLSKLDSKVEKESNKSNNRLILETGENIDTNISDDTSELLKDTSVLPKKNECTFTLNTMPQEESAKSNIRTTLDSGEKNGIPSELTSTPLEHKNSVSVFEEAHENKTLEGEENNVSEIDHTLISLKDKNSSLVDEEAHENINILEKEDNNLNTSGHISTSTKDKNNQVLSDIKDQDADENKNNLDKEDDSINTSREHTSVHMQDKHEVKKFNRKIKQTDKPGCTSVPLKNRKKTIKINTVEEEGFNELYKTKLENLRNQLHLNEYSPLRDAEMEIFEPKIEIIYESSCESDLEINNIKAINENQMISPENPSTRTTSINEEQLVPTESLLETSKQQETIAMNIIPSKIIETDLKNISLKTSNLLPKTFVQKTKISPILSKISNELDKNILQNSIIKNNSSIELIPVENFGKQSKVTESKTLETRSGGKKSKDVSCSENTIVKNKTSCNSSHSKNKPLSNKSTGTSVKNRNDGLKSCSNAATLTEDFSDDSSDFLKLTKKKRKIKMIESDDENSLQNNMVPAKKRVRKILETDDEISLPESSRFKCTENPSKLTMEEKSYSKRKEETIVNSNCKDSLPNDDMSICTIISTYNLENINVDINLTNPDLMSEQSNIDQQKTKEFESKIEVKISENNVDCTNKQNAQCSQSVSRVGSSIEIESIHSLNVSATSQDGKYQSSQDSMEVSNSSDTKHQSSQDSIQSTPSKNENLSTKFKRENQFSCRRKRRARVTAIVIKEISKPENKPPDNKEVNLKSISSDHVEGVNPINGEIILNDIKEHIITSSTCTANQNVNNSDKPEEENKINLLNENSVTESNSRTNDGNIDSTLKEPSKDNIIKENIQHREKLLLPSNGKKLNKKLFKKNVETGNEKNIVCEGENVDKVMLDNGNNQSVVTMLEENTLDANDLVGRLLKENSKSTFIEIPFNKTPERKNSTKLNESCSPTVTQNEKNRKNDLNKSFERKMKDSSVPQRESRNSHEHYSIDNVSSDLKWKERNAELKNQTFNYSGKKPKKRISHYGPQNCNKSSPLKSPLKIKISEAITTCIKISNFRGVISTQPVEKSEKINVLTPRKSPNNVSNSIKSAKKKDVETTPTLNVNKNVNKPSKPMINPPPSSRSKTSILFRDINNKLKSSDIECKTVQVKNVNSSIGNASETVDKKIKKETNIKNAFSSISKVKQETVGKPINSENEISAQSQSEKMSINMKHKFLIPEVLEDNARFISISSQNTKQNDPAISNLINQTDPTLRNSRPPTFECSNSSGLSIFNTLLNDVQFRNEHTLSPCQQSFSLMNQTPFKQLITGTFSCVSPMAETPCKNQNPSEYSTNDHFENINFNEKQCKLLNSKTPCKDYIGDSNSQNTEEIRKLEDELALTPDEISIETDSLTQTDLKCHLSAVIPKSNNEKNCGIKAINRNNSQTVSILNENEFPNDMKPEKALKNNDDMDVKQNRNISRTCKNTTNQETQIGLNSNLLNQKQQTPKKIPYISSTFNKNNPTTNTDQRKINRSENEHVSTVRNEKNIISETQREPISNINVSKHWNKNHEVSSSPGKNLTNQSRTSGYSSSKNMNDVKTVTNNANVSNDLKTSQTLKINFGEFDNRNDKLESIHPIVGSQRDARCHDISSKYSNEENNQSVVRNKRNSDKTNRSNESSRKENNRSESDLEDKGERERYRRRNNERNHSRNSPSYHRRNNYRNQIRSPEYRRRHSPHQNARRNRDNYHQNRHKAQNNSSDRRYNLGERLPMSHRNDRRSLLKDRRKRNNKDVDKYKERKSDERKSYAETPVKKVTVKEVLYYTHSNKRSRRSSTSSSERQRKSKKYKLNSSYETKSVSSSPVRESFSKNKKEQSHTEMKEESYKRKGEIRDFKESSNSRHHSVNKKDDPTKETYKNDIDKLSDSPKSDNPLPNTPCSDSILNFKMNKWIDNSKSDVESEEGLCSSSDGSSVRESNFIPLIQSTPCNSKTCR